MNTCKRGKSIKMRGIEELEAGKKNMKDYQSN
jgi:hypothetical protein